MTCIRRTPDPPEGTYRPTSAVASPLTVEEPLATTCSGSAAQAASTVTVSAGFGDLPPPVSGHVAHSSDKCTVRVVPATAVAGISALTPARTRAAAAAGEHHPGQRAPTAPHSLDDQDMVSPSGRGVSCSDVRRRCSPGPRPATPCRTRLGSPRTDRAVVAARALVVSIVVAAIAAVVITGELLPRHP